MLRRLLENPCESGKLAWSRNPYDMRGGNEPGSMIVAFCDGVSCIVMRSEYGAVSCIEAPASVM